MARGKNKHKEGRHGSSLKLEENPILAAALAKPAQKYGVRSGTSSPSSYRHVEIDGRSIEDAELDSEVPEGLGAVLEQISDGDTLGGHDTDGGLSETQSDAGEEDSYSTQGVRQNAQEKSANVQNIASIAGNAKGMRIVNQEVKKQTFTGLFSKNRLPSNGSKLEFFKLEDGPIKLGVEDLQCLDCPWERCLVGYFGGRFPGKQALNLIVSSWKVHPSIQFHGSGWMVFFLTRWRTRPKS